MSDFEHEWDKFHAIEKLNNSQGDKENINAEP